MDLKSRKTYIIVIGVLLVVAVILFVIGVVLYQVNNKCTLSPTNDRYKDRLVFGNFIKNVKKQYYELYANQVSFDPSMSVQNIINKFRPYDPSWQSIKSRTDAALGLLTKLGSLPLNKANLKPREKKGYAQVEHFLKSTFGKPYDENYYAGDWMMGPNQFCWQNICEIGRDLKNNLVDFQPNTLEDLEAILEIIQKHKKTIEMYKSNMVMGVNTGMVRSVEDCKSGVNAFKMKYPKVTEDGSQGILNESFVKHFFEDKYYSGISATVKNAFTSKYNKNIKQKLNETLVQHFGAPLHEFIQFLEKTHSRYCVPSNVSSGLANLPLKRVWFDQRETSKKTTMKLPTGEKLDGKKSYELILFYFTTSKKFDANSINELGETQKELLYKRAKEIAVKITGKENVATAVNVFKNDLNHQQHYFNTTAIPDDENGDIGGSRCKDMESAKKNCPVRYEAMMRWFDYIRPIIARLDTLTVDMFYMAGPRVTTPSCPVKLSANFNPSSGSQSYSGNTMCKEACKYFLPFFLKLPGPKYNAFSVAGHETRPGHHTQVQGFYERFSESGKKDVYDWLNGQTYYTAFTEGWALYAENPLLSTETNLYKDEPLQEYGMLKWQIWRALRLIIDTGLHSRGMNLQESLNLFEKFAWDTTDKAYKDTIRYMSDPGQATAYMIGQLAIWNMRNKTEEAFRQHNISFNEKEFHYQILSQGSSPLDYLYEYVDGYISCKINEKSSVDCPEILDPKLAAESPITEEIGCNERWQQIKNLKELEREHYD